MQYLNQYAWVNCDTKAMALSVVWWFMASVHGRQSTDRRQENGRLRPACLLSGATTCHMHERRLLLTCCSFFAPLKDTAAKTGCWLTDAPLPLSVSDSRVPASCMGAHHTLETFSRHHHSHRHTHHMGSLTIQHARLACAPRVVSAQRCNGSATSCVMSITTWDENIIGNI